MIEIYALISPLSKAVRYIGKAKNSSKRLASHIRDSKRRNTPVYQWIKTLLALGLMPEIIVLKTVPEKEWPQVEKETIREFKNKGSDLLNIADGGNEPHCSIKTRIKNGSNTFKKIRNTRLFELKRRLAISLSWMKKNAPDSYLRFANKYPTLI